MPADHSFFVAVPPPVPIVWRTPLGPNTAASPDPNSAGAVPKPSYLASTAESLSPIRPFFFTLSPSTPGTWLSYIWFPGRILLPISPLPCLAPPMAESSNGNPTAVAIASHDHCCPYASRLPGHLPPLQPPRPVARGTPAVVFVPCSAAPAGTQLSELLHLQPARRGTLRNAYRALSCS